MRLTVYQLSLKVSIHSKCNRKPFSGVSLSHVTVKIHFRVAVSQVSILQNIWRWQLNVICEKYCWQKTTYCKLFLYIIIQHLNNTVARMFNSEYHHFLKYDKNPWYHLYNKNFFTFPLKSDTPKKLIFPKMHHKKRTRSKNEVPHPTLCIYFIS